MSQEKIYKWNCLQLFTLLKNKSIPCMDKNMWHREKEDQAIKIVGL